jgi:hypothetical protein
MTRADGVLSDPGGEGPRRVSLFQAGGLILLLTVLLYLFVASRGQAIASSPIDMADIHLASSTYEFDLAITQTKNDCNQALTNGSVCLRYTLTVDETPIEAGYGVISGSTLQTNGANTTLTVDTSRASSPDFHRLRGSGGSISITWHQAFAGTVMSERGRSSRLWTCTAGGVALGRNLSGPSMHASMLVFN